MKEATLLQQIRNAAGSPIIIDRWVSIPEYNALIGGVSDSQYLFSLAADCVRPKTWTMGQYFAFVNKTAATGIGVGSNYLHIEIRNDNKRIWYY